MTHSLTVIPLVVTMVNNHDRIVYPLENTGRFCILPSTKFNNCLISCEPSKYYYHVHH